MNGPAARMCLSVGEVRRHIAARAPSKSAIVAKAIRKWDVDTAMERHAAERLRSCPPIRALQLDTLTGDTPSFGNAH